MKPINHLEFAKIYAQVVLENADEDRLFDEYCASSDCVTVKRMMRETECDPIVECDVVDIDHFNAWASARRGT